MIRIRILKVCDESVCKPLGIIFWSCLQNERFPPQMEKSQCGSKKKRTTAPFNNIFERLLYDSMFNFLTENSLISQNQSGFKPGDSCTNQLLSNRHQIYKYFDDGHEFRSVLLDMSKTFDKV